MQGIYFGRFEEVGRATNFDAAYLPEIRKELALLAMIGPVVIPPDHLISHPLALPALESLKSLVRKGRIGTSGSAGGLPPVGLLEMMIDERLEAIPHHAEDSMRREETFLIQRAENLRERIRDIFPEDFSIVRDISRQILEYSRTLANGLLEAAETHNFAEAKLLLEHATRSFDLDQGMRTYWIIIFRRLRGAINPESSRTLLMMIQSCYFRFGEIANNCIWYPDKFWVRLRRLSLPRTLLPTTVQSDFSYANIVKTASLLGADLEPALGLSDEKLVELIGSRKMQRFSAKLKKALLSARPKDLRHKDLEPRKLVDVRTWLEKYDPSLDEVMVAANLAVHDQDIFLSKTYSVMTSVIMQEEIGNLPPSSPDCVYSPRTRKLVRGKLEITLTPALAHLFMILVIHSTAGIPRWYIAQDELEGDVTDKTLIFSGKLNRIEKKILLLAKREREEQDFNLKRIRKRQERLQALLKPMGLFIRKNRFGLWSLTGGRVNVEGGKENGIIEKPESIAGPPRLRQVFEILASYYPYAVPSQEVVSFLQIRSNLPGKIDVERKAWRDVSALKRYLRKSPSRCAV
ncbi:MAG: hypothetical protein WAN11_24045, partial [Syntrophobacteraceae bacterium]